jgi:hypothetical protein
MAGSSGLQFKPQCCQKKKKERKETLECQDKGVPCVHLAHGVGWALWSWTTSANTVEATLLVLWEHCLCTGACAWPCRPSSENSTASLLALDQKLGASLSQTIPSISWSLGLLAMEGGIGYADGQGAFQLLLTLRLPASIFLKNRQRVWYLGLAHQHCFTGLSSLSLSKVISSEPRENMVVCVQLWGNAAVVISWL